MWFVGVAYFRDPWPVGKDCPPHDGWFFLTSGGWQTMCDPFKLCWPCTERRWKVSNEWGLWDTFKIVLATFVFLCLRLSLKICHNYCYCCAYHCLYFSWFCAVHWMFTEAATVGANRRGRAERQKAKLPKIGHLEEKWKVDQTKVWHKVLLQVPSTYSIWQNDVYYYPRAHIMYTCMVDNYVITCIIY